MKREIFMKKIKLKIFSLLLVFSFIFINNNGIIVNAAQITNQKNISQYNLSLKAITSIAEDPYESNNNISEAYPYSKTKVLSGNSFIEGYRNSNIHVLGDVDFFYITLTAGVTYDVVLKNIYGEDRHIYLWRDNGNGTWTRWKKSNQVPGQPEHYRFTPSVSGIYYIEISGGDPYSLYYFFAVERKGTINTNLWP
jgi:hypothetical protein